MTVVDDLKAAKAAIEERGWCQWKLHVGQRVCVVGALNLVCNGGITQSVDDWSRRNAAYDALQSHLSDEFVEVTDFNDDPTTIQRDILDLFDKALANLGGLG